MSRLLTRARRAVAASAVGALALGGLVALGAAPAQAFDSSCNPAELELKTLEVSPTKVNVKTGKRTVKVSGTTSGPALTFALALADPVGKGNNLVAAASTKGNKFAIKIEVPKGASKGKHILSLSFDSADQSLWLDADALAADEFPHSFNVISRPDLKAPKLTSIKLSKKSVNTTKKTAKFTVTAKATDKGGSGLDYAHVYVGNKTNGVHADLKLKKGKFTGTVEFPRWAGNKKASVLEANVRDKAGNWTDYGKGRGMKKLTRKIKPSLKVKSKTDTSAPVVKSASGTPSSIKIGAQRRQMEFAVKATDSQSGVASVSIGLVPRDSAADHPSTGAWMVKKKGTWRGTATISCEELPGTYDIQVTVVDRVGRETVTNEGTVTFTE